MESASLRLSHQIGNEGEYAVEGVHDVATITNHFSSLTDWLLRSLVAPSVAILSTLTSWSPAIIIPVSCCYALHTNHCTLHMLIGQNILRQSRCRGCSVQQMHPLLMLIQLSTMNGDTVAAFRVKIKGHHTRHCRLLSS
jgi:hypothetical protein